MSYPPNGVEFKPINEDVKFKKNNISIINIPGYKL